jgi:hypothetical protein
MPFVLFLRAHLTGSALSPPLFPLIVNIHFLAVAHAINISEKDKDICKRSLAIDSQMGIRVLHA